MVRSSTYALFISSLVLFKLPSIFIVVSIVENRSSTLVFAVNVEHIRSLTDAFRQAGVDARFLYAGTPRVERAEVMERFRRQEFPVLVNCGK